MSVRGRVAAVTVLCALAAACTPIATVQKLPGTGTPAPVVTPAPKVTPTPIPPKPTSTAAPAPAYPGVMLAFGMTSASVTFLQQKLGVSPATGYFGAVTAAAVKTFQQAHGLVVDGQVGPLTWAMIFGSTIVAPVSGTPAPTPTPAPTSSPTTPAKPAPPSYPALTRPAGLGASALPLVAKYAGKPYLWGAAGPNAFDCSGLTMYVYKQLGVLLQRSANDQFRTTLHVRYADAQPGDLIFFYDTTGYVYHVGMYAGNGMMWDAPHTGAVVRYENVWYPDSVWVGVPGAKLK